MIGPVWSVKALEMYSPSKPDARPNEQLDAADDEEPRADCRGGLREEKDASDNEHHADEEVVGGAEGLVTVPDNELVVSNRNIEVGRILVVLRIGHRDIVPDRPPGRDPGRVRIDVCPAGRMGLRRLARAANQERDDEHPDPVRTVLAAGAPPVAFRLL